MERQNHGFSFEQQCKDKYSITLSGEYMSKWDGEFNGLPISIKTEKFGSDVEMADFFRNQQVNEDFYLLVGFWKDQKDNIVEEHLLKIKGDEYHQMFSENYNDRLHNLLDNITNDKSDDAKWKEQIASIRKDWENDTLNLIRLRFKRDHKHQKRIQCAINNKDFYNHFIPNYEVI